MSKVKLLAMFVFLFVAACSNSDEGGVNFTFGQCQNSAQGKALLKADAIYSASDLATDVAEDEKIAVLTNQRSVTNVHLPLVHRCCESNVKIKANKTNDTLKLKEYFPDGDYYASKCSCSSTLDITLETKEDNIKYVVYEDQYVYPVKYE
jgi:hypothetical protein